MCPPIARRALLRTFAVAAGTLAVFWPAAPSARSEPAVGGMVEVTVDGQRIEGAPLAWSKRWIHVLGRDGRLWTFASSEVDELRPVSARFQSYSPSEIRSQLLRELGPGFEVSGTGHYLIAHPRGQRDVWASRFEDLYRSFVHYFSVRGFDVDEPDFPLVGIVCRNRDDFLRFSAGQRARVSPGMIGYYAVQSNRIVLYDTGDRGAGADWMQTRKTIIHEATHQTAFNTGIHDRCAIPPLWVAEGLAMMFEAPGVYNARVHRDLRDRIHAKRLEDFRKLAALGWPDGIVADLIASDRLFSSRPGAAYAVAWALTFYLVETQPRRYAEYVARTADRLPFEEYTPQQRTADFEAVFGSDMRMLEARLLRYVKTLP